MSDTKVYQFGTEGNASLNALLPFLQQKGIDPAVLYNMGNNGLFGNNGMEFLLLLIILAAANGNGNGFFGGGNNNSAEREMLMSAIQRQRHTVRQQLVGICEYCWRHCLLRLPEPSDHRRTFPRMDNRQTCAGGTYRHGYDC